tara:strand:+ start:2712 stop:3173 length:462 start_codon:yes stop_codon:yes gene_type:complete
MKCLILFLSFISILSCSFNKVVKHHGVHFLEKKHQKLTINETNKNDILKLLGEPSSKSSFDNDVWIYIERKVSTGKLYKLGRQKLLVNNVLVLELNSMGLLAEKKLYKKEDMNDLEFAKNSTDPAYRKRSFVYDFLSSMRQKINDPLGKRKKK